MGDIVVAIFGNYVQSVHAANGVLTKLSVETFTTAHHLNDATQIGRGGVHM
jgi:hypothetical protein